MCYARSAVTSSSHRRDRTPSSVTPRHYGEPSTRRCRDVERCRTAACNPIELRRALISDRGGVAVEDVGPAKAGYRRPCLRIRDHLSRGASSEQAPPYQARQRDGADVPPTVRGACGSRERRSFKEGETPPNLTADALAVAARTPRRRQASGGGYRTAIRPLQCSRHRSGRWPRRGWFRILPRSSWIAGFPPGRAKSWQSCRDCD